MRRLLTVALAPLFFVACANSTESSRPAHRPWFVWRRPASPPEPAPAPKPPEKKAVALLIEIGVSGHLQFEDKNLEIRDIPEFVRQRQPDAVYIHVWRGPYMDKATEARDAFRNAGYYNVRILTTEP